ncbi:hypothetical protein FQN60_018597 [Etheostoma spectabile]|uniref:Uncharacterized protein n=1 Tax=Etheostoma spectabile TaxID=54343 RepID=A0A5J5DIG1_9PERO|nr:hypothetical protein FQN60_018597 [Etheostoma spectabile]
MSVYQETPSPTSEGTSRKLTTQLAEETRSYRLFISC